MIKALGIYSDHSGCDYHRVKLPFQYGGEYLNNSAFSEAAGDLSKLMELAEIVVVNRDCQLDSGFLPACKKHGIKVVLDLDDYWELSPSHYMAEFYRRQRIPERIVRNIRLADAVTVTTARLADKVKPLNRNVHVIPNALPFGHGQFKYNHAEPYEVFSVIYAGQKSHLNDLGLLERTMRRFSTETKPGISFVLAGFQEGDKVWQQMESVFTDSGQVKNYFRLPNAPLDSYMKVYQTADAVLVPLLNNSFNRHKSNLKLLEAAAQKLPVTCSRVSPYWDDQDAPVLWVDNEAQWYEHITYLAENRSYAREMGERLHEWAISKYDLLTWNKTRFELYHHIVNC